MSDLAIDRDARAGAGRQGSRRYAAFGLVIDSGLPLPELTPVETQGAADITVRLTRIERRADQPGRSVYRYGEAEQYLYWPEVGAFVIRGDNAIDIDPALGASDALLRLPLLGPVMALLLHQRGELVLHASAVEIAGRVAVFLGDKGAGKSTTTAAAIDRGHALFTDDLLPVRFNADGQPISHPGFPSVKLVAGCSSRFSLDGAGELAIPHPDFPKRVRRITTSFSQASSSVAALYVLWRCDRTEIEPFARDEALRMIMRFAYVPLFDGKRWNAAEAGRHFAQCAALAGKTRVARLRTPSDLSRMDEIITAVENDLAGLPA